MYHIVCSVYRGTGRNVLRGLPDKVMFEQILEEKYQWNLHGNKKIICVL